MLKKEDLKQIHDKGINEEQINRQLEDFIRGFPYLKLEGAATPKKGVTVLDKNACEAACKAWQDYQNHGHKVVKFVPASGAASRMFKDLLHFSMEITKHLLVILKRSSSQIFITLRSTRRYQPNVSSWKVKLSMR